MYRKCPNPNDSMRNELLAAVEAAYYPISLESLVRNLEEKRGRPCSQPVVQTCLRSLCRERLVYRQALPTGRGRKPLVIYFPRNL